MKNSKIIFIIIIVGLVIALAYFFVIKGFGKNNGQSYSASALTDTNGINLSSQTNNEGGVSVEVRPVDFQPGGQTKFEISFDTHQGDLDFDLTKISVLTDDQGNQYLPLEWQGGQGGHHLSGTLIFSAISGNVKQIKLILGDIYGVKEREFSWKF